MHFRVVKVSGSPGPVPAGSRSHADVQQRIEQHPAANRLHVPSCMQPVFVVAGWGALICCAAAEVRGTSVRSRLKKWISNELLVERSGIRAKAAGRQHERCLASFNSDPRFAKASGQSFFAEGWWLQLQECISLGARYILYSHGLEASQQWTRDISSTGIAGKLLVGYWAVGRQAELLPNTSSLRLMGLCVPSHCSRASELSLGWHVLLLMHGHSSKVSVRAPIRSRVRLRISRSKDAARARQLGSLLERLRNDSRMPAWYLDPAAWPALSASWTSDARKLTQDFFRDLWGAYIYRMHVNQRYRYALCSIPKVGLMQFFLLNHRLDGSNMTYSDIVQTEFRTREVGTRFRVNQLYWKRSEWKLAVFLRDPLERFLSAFMDKCMRFSNLCSETHRQGWETVTSKSPVGEQVRAFRAFASQLPTPGMSVNDHWIPQSLYLNHGCKLTWQRIDFAGLLTSDRSAVNWQIFEMLHAVLGLSFELSEALADAYFPAAGHATKLAAQRTTTYREDDRSMFVQFYDQESARRNGYMRACPYCSIGECKTESFCSVGKAPGLCAYPHVTRVHVAFHAHPPMLRGKGRLTVWNFEETRGELALVQSGTLNG